MLIGDQKRPSRGFDWTGAGALATSWFIFINIYWRPLRVPWFADLAVKVS